MLGLGLSITSRGSPSIGGTSGPRILLPSATIADSASVGDTIGTLSVSNGSGTYTFTLTSNPDSLFSISGSDLQVADALTAGSYSITVQADNGVDTPISRAFLITVTAPLSYNLTGGIGSFALTGIGMTPVVDTVFSVDAGSFALNGQTAGVLYKRNLSASLATFALTGNSASLTKQDTGAYTLSASAGTFTLTGNAATLTDTPAPASFGITYVDNKSSVASSTSYTFTGGTALGIGTPDPNRRVVLALGIRATSAISITGVTVDYGTGPQAASLVVERNITNAQDTSLWQVDAPTGTTATVVVTLANAATRVAIASYSLITTTPTAASTASSASVAPSNTVTVPSGGGSIIASFVTGGTSATPSNYTEDIDIIIPTTTINLTTGHDTTNTGSVTYTVTWAVTPSNPNAVFAAWGP